MRKFVVASVMIFILLINSRAVESQSDGAAITAANIGQLNQHHVFDGDCIGFDPAETMIATTTGLFELDDGGARIDLSANPISSVDLTPFSPTGAWFVAEDRIYDVETGDEVFALPHRQVFIAFSETDSLAHVHGIAYDTETWQPVDTDSIPEFALFVGLSGQRYVWRDMTSGNGVPTYLSPGGTYWANAFEGIYRVDSGEQIALPDHLNDMVALQGSTFSPNDLMFFVGGDGFDEYVAYTTPSFERAYELAFDVGNRQDAHYVEFSPNSLFTGVPNDGIYQVNTGELLFEIAGYPTFGHGNVWVGTSDGLYVLPTGRQVQEFSGSSLVMGFSDSEELVAVFPDGVYEVNNALILIKPCARCFSVTIAPW